MKTLIVIGWLSALAIASAIAIDLSVLPGASNRWRLHVAPTAIILALTVAVGWFAIGGSVKAMAPLALSMAFVLPLLGSGISAVVGAVTGNLFFSRVTWWAPGLALQTTPAILFVVVGTFVAWWSQRPSVGKSRAPALALALTLALALLAQASMLPFRAPGAQEVLWHHWGAYVSPALSIVGGGTPFRDFPVQYGLGPTLAIAGMSAHDLWYGAFLLTLLTNFLYLACLSLVILVVTRELPAPLRVVAIVAEVVAAVAWTGYPPDFGGPMMAPSVSGARFGLLAALLLAVVWGETREKPSEGTEYGLWFLALAWSPEAAVYSSILVAPMVVLRELRARRPGTARQAAVIVGFSGLKFVAKAALAMALLAVAFRIGFGAWPSPRGYAVYLLSPPGEMLPSLDGPIWLLFAIGVAGLASFRRARPQDVALGMACLLTLLGTSSYYFLGRSHDNNILNLLPFCVPVLACALGSDAVELVRGFSRMQLVAIIAWVATFGFGWVSEAVEAPLAADFGPGHALRMMDLTQAESADNLAIAQNSMAPGPHPDIRDFGAAIAYVKSRGEGPPLLDNQLFLLPRDLDGPVWTGMNDLANFYLLPPEVIRRYVAASAAAYRRPGWIIEDAIQPEPHVRRFFDPYYSVTETRTFGGVRAYRMTPN